MSSANQPLFNSMKRCLLLLADRARAAGRSADCDLIMSALKGDVRGELLARIGDVALTPKQWNVLEIVDAYWREFSCSPTLNEIADRLGTTKVTAWEHVRTLVARGVLIKMPNQARALKVADRLN